MKNGLPMPTYQTHRAGGSEHQPQFRSTVVVGDVMGDGVSEPGQTFFKTKRVAEMAAAKQVYGRLFFRNTTEIMRIIGPVDTVHESGVVARVNGGKILISGPISRHITVGSTIEVRVTMKK